MRSMLVLILLALGAAALALASEQVFHWAFAAQRTYSTATQRITATRVHSWELSLLLGCLCCMNAYWVAYHPRENARLGGILLLWIGGAYLLLLFGTFDSGMSQGTSWWPGAPNAPLPWWTESAILARMVLDPVFDICIGVSCLAAGLGLYVWRVHRPYAAGHCHACGYNLTGNVSGVCPECGEQV